MILKLWNVLTGVLGLDDWYSVGVLNGERTVWCRLWDRNQMLGVYKYS